MSGALSANEPGVRRAHLDRGAVDVCTLTRASFGLLFLIEHLTTGNWEFFQLDEP